jgi:hypothetical protein
MSWRRGYSASCLDGFSVASSCSVCLKDSPDDSVGLTSHDPSDLSSPFFSRTRKYSAEAGLATILVLQSELIL